MVMVICPVKMGMIKKEKKCGVYELGGRAYGLCMLHAIRALRSQRSAEGAKFI